jgi:N-acetylmuramoyl-L-alanine amidase
VAPIPALAAAIALTFAAATVTVSPADAVGVVAADGAGCVRDAAKAKPGPLDGWVFGLDPGHAGKSSSSLNHLVSDGRGGRKTCNNMGTSTAAGYPERVFNLDIAERVAKLLRKQGARVRLTRTSESAVGPCVDKRGTFGQRIGADAVISIHADGSTNRSARGYHAIVSSPPLNKAQGKPSVKLAEAILKAMDKAGFTRNPAYPGGLSKRRDIAGVNHSKVPVVMMELGMMTYASEGKTMASAKGRARYARAVAEGIAAWAKASAK